MYKYCISRIYIYINNLFANLPSNFSRVVKARKLSPYSLDIRREMSEDIASFNQPEQKIRLRPAKLGFLPEVSVVITPLIAVLTPVTRL